MTIVVSPAQKKERATDCGVKLSFFSKVFHYEDNQQRKKLSS